MAIKEIRTSIGNIGNKGDDSFLGKIGKWFSAKAVGLLITLIAWFFLASIFPRALLPNPFETAGLTWGIVADGTFWTHFSKTFATMTLSFTLSMITAVVLGVLMGVNDYSRSFFTPYVNIGLSMPGLGWAVAFFIVYAYATVTIIPSWIPMLSEIQTAPVIATVLTVTPYLAINIWKGVENIRGDLIKMSQSFDLSGLRMVRWVILPNIGPQLFSATRLGVAIAWKVVTLTEVVAAQTGVGFKLMQQYQLYKYEAAWAWMGGFLVIIILIDYGLFRPIEKKVFEYRDDTELSQLSL